MMAKTIKVTNATSATNKGLFVCHNKSSLVLNDTLALGVEIGDDITNKNYKDKISSNDL